MNADWRVVGDLRTTKSEATTIRQHQQPCVWSVERRENHVTPSCLRPCSVIDRGRRPITSPAHAHRQPTSFHNAVAAQRSTLAQPGAWLLCPSSGPSSQNRKPSALFSISGSSYVTISFEMLANIACHFACDREARL